MMYSHNQSVRVNYKSDIIIRFRQHKFSLALSNMMMLTKKSRSMVNEDKCQSLLVLMVADTKLSV